MCPVVKYTCSTFKYAVIHSLAQNPTQILLADTEASYQEQILQVMASDKELMRSNGRKISR